MKNKIWLISLLLFGVFMTSLIPVDAEDMSTTVTLLDGQQMGGFHLYDIFFSLDSCKINYATEFYVIEHGETRIMPDGLEVTVTGISSPNLDVGYCKLTLFGDASLVSSSISNPLLAQGSTSSSSWQIPEVAISDLDLELNYLTEEDLTLEADSIDQEAIKINRISGESSEIKVNGFSVYTTINVAIDGNKLFLEEQEVKIMPKKLNEKFKNIERVDLKLIEEKPVYVVEHKEDYKLFGVIPIKPTVITQVSAEDEEILKTEKSDWLFLAKKQ